MFSVMPTFEVKNPSSVSSRAMRMNGFWLLLAGQRRFERLLHERGALRGVLFEERLAGRCRRGVELGDARA